MSIITILSVIEWIYKVYHKQIYINSREPADILKHKIPPSPEWAVTIPGVNILRYNKSGMERLCVSKCLSIPANGMNLELFVVKYSDFDFSNTKSAVVGDPLRGF